MFLTITTRQPLALISKLKSIQSWTFRLHFKCGIRPDPSVSSALPVHTIGTVHRANRLINEVTQADLVTFMPFHRIDLNQKSYCQALQNYLLFIPISIWRQVN